MAKSSTSTPQRSPRGTNIIINAFMDALNSQPTRWQKAAGLEALTKLLLTVKAMPTWQDPKAPTTTTSSRQSKATGSKSGRGRPSGISSRGTTGTRGNSGTNSSSQNASPADANSLAHPDQQI